MKLWKLTRLHFYRFVKVAVDRVKTHVDKELDKLIKEV